MFGTSLQFGRSLGDDRFYSPVKSRRNRQQLQKNRINGGLETDSSEKSKFLTSENLDIEDRTVSKDLDPARGPSSNLDRFLESIAPSVPAQYLSKTRMRGLRTCDVEFLAYFTLGDLWDSFKEWSAYGVGVPLVLDETDYVVQYYVPYLSGIQLYGASGKSESTSRRIDEESENDSYKDSSSDSSSDCEIGRSSPWNSYYTASKATHRLDRLSLTEKCTAVSDEGFSSDDGEAGNSYGHLLFEYFERDQPYSRKPLADKILYLSSRFPKLETLRSCDLLPASWISVAWYPIYRIPTGPTLRDLDACFLTFHSLSTPMSAGGGGQGPPTVIYPQGDYSAPKILLPTFGLASYKFKGSMWTVHGGSERQLATSLLQAADNWLRLLQVNHPDFQFFSSHGMCHR